MKVYFSGSIRGGRDDKALYLSIIGFLSEYGQVLTEHIGSKELTAMGTLHLTDEEIYEKDMAWLREADVVVAEITTPSMGVGYELGKVEEMNKPLLCLYRDVEGRRVSAMITGNKDFVCKKYLTLEDVKPILKEFFGKIGK
jgi:nucleoside 2-deoxyribosyltransferase